MIVKGLLQQL